MTTHSKRTKRKANGFQAGALVRFATGYRPDDFRRAQFWADKKGVPLATILRDALTAYVYCIKADADRAAGLDVGED